MTAGTRLAIVAGICTATLVGGGLAGPTGAVAGLTVGLLGGVAPWHGHPLWVWLGLWVQRRRPIIWRDPVTVTNDRSGGGVRYCDGVAVTAVQVLGRAHEPTLFTGAASTHTDNTLDIAELVPLLHQSLGLAIDSISLISAGARRANTGSYPNVYDSLLGTPPYAGRRETWLIIRISSFDNVEALRWRISSGAAAVAAAQRIAATLRQRGTRAKVATASDITALELRLGRSALNPTNRRWHTLRGGGGWLTTYWYHPSDRTTGKLAQAWSWRVDGIIQNITVFGDRTATATVTVQTAQPPTAPPSVLLRTLPGQQVRAGAANLCGPAPRLCGVRRGKLAESLVIPVGPSGVLLGKLSAGDRLLLPLDDPAELSRIQLAAEDALAKRIIVRLAGAGERITVHTHDRRRWESLRMPAIAVTGHVRPVAGSTVSVVDGTLAPVPRPNTVISIGDPGTECPNPADVVITQTGPAEVEVITAAHRHRVVVELFRAENRYLAPQRPSGRAVELQPVD